MAPASSDPDAAVLEDDEEEFTPTPRRGPTRTVVAIVAVIALVIGGGLGFAGGLFSSIGGEPTPSTTSAEAGFARDMQTHHLQGAELALIIHDISTDSLVRSVSKDILLTQQQQSGQMFGWLVSWGLPQASPEPSMTWMTRAALDPTSTDDAHAHMGDGTTPLPERMPGLATPEQIAQLQASTGTEADILFLQLMIAHHQGAIEMGESVLARSRNPIVTTFATGVVRSQQAEIDLMTTMLADRGATP